MSTSVAPLPSRTSLVPTPSATWHVGISPTFPSSLTLSNDAAIESLLTDIPFLSVGLLGFGVLTFFFAMRKSNLLSLYVFASVIVAFIAGVLDVSQVLARGGALANKKANDTSSVLALLVARELALAVSVGIRFLFFWTFVSMAPRGERPSTSTPQEQRPNFLRMGPDVHSGGWSRWGAIGVFFKYILLLATIAIPVLQLIWRFVAQFSRIGPVYNADGALQIIVSTLFILKMFVNVWLSPLIPRWKTMRDYLPIIVALLIGLGVGVGNILCFEFSETSLGRLFQAVELYILVLFILISTFYHQRVRVSIISTPQNPRGMAPTSFGGLQPETLSKSLIVPPNLSTPESAAAVYPERAAGRVGGSSTAEKLASWLRNRNLPGRRDREKSRLWNKDDMEAGVFPVDEKTRDDAALNASPAKRRGTTTWKDPMNTSAAVRGRFEETTTVSRAPPIVRGNATSPNGTIPSFTVGNYGTESIFPSSKQTYPPGSPVYGLEGIVRYHDKTSSRPLSTQSSGVESLLRQQAELDKSVAELQMFSSSSRLVSAAASGGMLSAPGERSGSPRSEFSLSNFPEPPVELAVNLPKDAEAMSPAGDTIVTPRPQQALLSAARSNYESNMGEPDTTERATLGPSITQNNVTFSISDTTTPSFKARSSHNERLSPLVERPSLETMPQVTVVESASQLDARRQAQPPVLVDPEQAPPPARLRRVRQGLPSRSQLNISGPIPRVNVEKSTAYERPRPVPAP